MKILHCVESYHPSVGGMQYVVQQLSSASHGAVTTSPWRRRTIRSAPTP